MERKEEPSLSRRFDLALQAGQEALVYQRMQAMIRQFEASNRREQQRQQRQRMQQEQEARYDVCAIPFTMTLLLTLQLP